MPCQALFPATAHVRPAGRGVSLLAGERDPRALAALRYGKCKHSALGAVLRRKAAHLGMSEAITATTSPA
jgi:hypothetical protein